MILGRHYKESPENQIEFVDIFTMFNWRSRTNYNHYNVESLPTE